LAAVIIVWTPGARGQTATSEIVGRITDSTGAVVPQADVAVINVETNVKRTVQSGASGNYTISLLRPGLYRLTVTKAGFKLAELPEITLTVNQTLTQDVTLAIGSLTQTVEVKAEAELIQAATSELGTVVGQKATNELPLNGRQFSQLLTLVPGVSPVNTSQNTAVSASVDLGVLGVPTATFALPAVAGQWNRSNMYMLDGVSNTEFLGSVYVIPPIVDSIEEFKVQMHNDKAEYGGVLGGVVNVITKGGTNGLHGSAYEFVRNNWFDARNPFADEFRSGPAPFRQNQFGLTVGGPLVIPKLYNGRNRTFFYFGYEGWRYTQAAQARYYVPTDAELSGDFSHSLINQNIYDPETTVPDPSNPGKYLRTQFQYNGVLNVIPPNRIDPNVVTFIKTYFDRPILVGDPVHNDLVTRPNIATANEWNGRLDELIGNKDSLFFRWSEVDASQFTATSTLQTTGGDVPARQVAAGWNHTFSPTLILETRGGATQRPFLRYTDNSAGMAAMVGIGMTASGGSTIALASPWGSAGINTGGIGGHPTYHISGNLTWVHGRHNAKFGAQLIKQGTDGSGPAQSSFTFNNAQTENPEEAGTTGASLASALLGLPSQTNIGLAASYSSLRYSTWGAYAQDEWRLRNNVTLTYGLRLDLRRPFVTGTPNSTYVSGPVPKTGDYWIGLNKMPGLCSVVGTAPCLPAPLSEIPNGNHIMLSPFGSAWGPATEWDDWGPRVGVAWRLNQKTVIRGGYGVVYDPLSGLDQDWKGIIAQWPAAGGGWSNLTWNAVGQPLTPIEKTYGLQGRALPTADPWEQVNWYFDPYRKDARSQQWHVEVQRQATENLVLSIGYVGSYSDRLDVTGLWNTATTPGPGTTAQVQARRPFPWWPGTNFMGTSRGTATYNGLEARLQRRFANGLYYLVSYTWSKSMDIGSSGWFDAENGAGGGLQNYYDANGSRSLSSYDVPHFLSMSGVYELPFGRGKKYFSQHGAASWIFGNWQTNGILQLRSGQPYTVSVSGDVANIGNTVAWFNYARPNLVGNPNLSNRTSEKFLDTSAFAVPSFSYGDLGRNTMRSAPVYTADFSLFKNFPVREGMNLAFRVELFNIFNIQNYAPPDALVGDPAFGRVTSITNAARQIQLALRLTF